MLVVVWGIGMLEEVTKFVFSFKEGFIALAKLPPVDPPLVCPDDACFSLLLGLRDR